MKTDLMKNEQNLLKNDGEALLAAFETSPELADLMHVEDNDDHFIVYYVDGIDDLTAFISPLITDYKEKAREPSFMECSNCRTRYTHADWTCKKCGELTNAATVSIGILIVCGIILLIFK